MVILVGPRLPIVDPFTLAEVNFAVPRSSRGSSPESDEGAPLMTSAEERVATASDLCSVAVQPPLESISVR